MKRKVLISVLLIAVIIASMFTGAWAASNLEEISALLNRGVVIEYNNVPQTFKDANGTVVYPITYNGTTYLPVRAIANLFGIPVDWDGARNTVVLGVGLGPKDLAKGTTGQSEYNYVSSDPAEINGHTSCIVMRTPGRFDESWIYDASNAFLKGADLKSYQYDTIVKSDVTGIKEISFDLWSNCHNGEVYVYGANSKADIGKDDIAITTLAQYKLTEDYATSHKTLTIDMNKYDTIMFRFDPTTSGEKPSSESEFKAYIYDLTGIPA